MNKDQRIERLEKALELAMCIIGQREPDSLCISNDFIALASVQCECEDEKTMTYIDESILRDRPSLYVETPVEISVVEVDHEELELGAKSLTTDSIQINN